MGSSIDGEYYTKSKQNRNVAKPVTVRPTIDTVIIGDVCITGAIQRTGAEREI